MTVIFHRLRIWIFVLLLIIFCINAYCQENTAIICGDGLDNDQNGQIDCEDMNCRENFSTACRICGDGKGAFAEFLAEYLPGCPDLKLNEPSAALGVADWNDPNDGHAVALGEGGSIVLGFKSNVLVNSGDDRPDLFVFEVGDIVETCQLLGKPFDEPTRLILNKSLSSAQDTDGYYFLGRIEADNKAIDLDAFYPGLGAGVLRFDLIRIIDLPDLDCSETINPGADIDALCAISSMPVDCMGQVGGSAIWNNCGVCVNREEMGRLDDCIGEVYFPNAFSPNGDGQNDFFNLYTSPSDELMINFFEVYNHWGQRVVRKEKWALQSNDHLWDGTINATDAPCATYIFRCEIIFGNGDTGIYSGPLTLLR